MRYAGIDIGSEQHVVAVVDERAEVLVASSGFGEDSEGYAKLLAQLGDPADVLVAMEATGHYWQNLFAVLSGKGFTVALLNALSTRRFAENSGTTKSQLSSVPPISWIKTSVDAPSPARL